MSFVAGGGTGALFLWAAQDLKQRLPQLKMVNIALMLLMVKRFYDTKKFMPAGLVSTSALILHLNL